MCSLFYAVDEFVSLGPWLNSKAACATGKCKFKKVLVKSSLEKTKTSDLLGETHLLTENAHQHVIMCFRKVLHFWRANKARDLFDFRGGWKSICATTKRDEKNALPCGFAWWPLLKLCLMFERVDWKDPGNNWQIPGTASFPPFFCAYFPQVFEHPLPLL